MSAPIDFYCVRCSAGPGAPCRDLVAGGELEGFHQGRILLAGEKPR